MSLYKRVTNFLEFWYYQYILHTALYMLESWERGIFSFVNTKVCIENAANFPQLSSLISIVSSIWHFATLYSLLVAFLAMASYTAYLYLPGHIMMLIGVCQYILGLSNISNITTPSTDAAADMTSR